MRKFIITLFAVTLLASTAAKADLYDDYIKANQDHRTMQQTFIDEGLIPNGYVDPQDAADNAEIAKMVSDINHCYKIAMQRAKVDRQINEQVMKDYPQQVAESSSGHTSTYTAHRFGDVSKPYESSSQTNTYVSTFGEQ